MDAANLVASFGQEAGIALALGDKGTVALAFEGGPTVHLEHDAAEDVLHVYAVIGTDPADPARSATLHRQLLQANAFGRDTGGAVLGLDEFTDEIVLSQRLPLASADTAMLRGTIEIMVPVAQEWLQRLEEAAPVRTASSPVAATAFGLRV